jgi:hypothetical protein
MEGPSVNSPQSPNESSSHDGSGGGLLSWACFFEVGLENCREAGAVSSREREPSKSTVVGALGAFGACGRGLVAGAFASCAIAAEELG